MNQRDTDRVLKQMHGHISKLREEQQDQAVGIAGSTEKLRHVEKAIYTLTYRVDTSDRRMDGVEMRLCLAAIVIALLTGFVGGVLSNPILSFIAEVRQTLITKEHACPTSNPNCVNLPSGAQPKASAKQP